MSLFVAQSCGIFNCQIYFIISLITTTILMLAINFWVYVKVAEKVSQLYPEKPCGA